MTIFAATTSTRARSISSGYAMEEFRSRRRMVRTRFGHISHWELGAGPTAIFLHGWPLNSYHWRDAMMGLADVRRCIAPDFMGLGYSDVPANTDLSPANQCAMIIAFMDVMEIARADLVSNDSGTTVAQLVATRHPSRVNSLLITNGDVHTNSPPEGLKPAIEEARADRLADIFERHLKDLEFAQGPQGLGGLTYTNPLSLTVQSIDVYLTPLLSTPKRRRQCQDYGVAFEPNPLLSIERQLRRLQIPARMLWGTGDKLFPVDWAHWLDRALPNSRGVRIVDGANLFFTEEFPDIVIEEARRLWLSI